MPLIQEMKTLIAEMNTLIVEMNTWRPRSLKLERFIGFIGYLFANDNFGKHLTYLLRLFHVVI